MWNETCTNAFFLCNCCLNVIWTQYYFASKEARQLPHTAAQAGTPSPPLTTPPPPPSWSYSGWFLQDDPWALTDGRTSGPEVKGVYTQPFSNFCKRWFTWTIEISLSAQSSCITTAKYLNQIPKRYGACFLLCHGSGCQFQVKLSLWIN